MNNCGKTCSLCGAFEEGPEALVGHECNSVPDEAQLYYKNYWLMTYAGRAMDAYLNRLMPDAMALGKVSVVEGRAEATEHVQNILSEIPAMAFDMAESMIKEAEKRREVKP